MQVCKKKEKENDLYRQDLHGRVIELDLQPIAMIMQSWIQ
jgi:hypothetical protein